jgi:hypothetical protein
MPASDSEKIVKFFVSDIESFIKFLPKDKIKEIKTTAITTSKITVIKGDIPFLYF